MKKEHLLFNLILCTSVFLSAAGFIGQLDVYADYDRDVLKEPAVSLVMRGLHDGISPFRVTLSDEDESDEGLSEPGIFEDDENDDNIPSGNDVSTNGTVLDKGNRNEAVSENTPAAENDDGVTTESEGKRKDDNKDNMQDGEQADRQNLEDEDDQTDNSDSDGGRDKTGDSEDDGDGEPRSFTSVDDDYFSDALFIGDSRMEGLSRYVEPIDSRADFYTKTALTIYDLKDGKSVKTEMGTMSLWSLLDEKQYGKIYLMVGLNEIGTGNPEYFKKAYAEVIDEIREREPDAIIFINGIIHVSAAKSASDPYFNNPKINERNAAIATLADNIDIFYIDVNEALDDAGGNLRAEITFDEVHMKGSCYDPWYKYLITHGVE